MQQCERLRKYNRLRRGDKRLKMPDPKELGELIDGVADRLEVLEREHTEFFDRWHDERRKREAMAVHYDHLCSLVLAAGMLAPHGSGAKEILDEAEQYMVSAAESWRRSNAEVSGAGNVVPEVDALTGDLFA